MRKIIFIFLCLGFAACCAYAQGPVINLEPITKEDRILILAPHPDDETIGCAGIIQEAIKAGADVHVVYLTHGDHNQFAFIVYNKNLTIFQEGFIRMGKLRQKEAVKAMELLGLDKNNLVFMGYPDFGTFTIFKDFWRSSQPFMSLLTRISSVPYKEDFSYAAPYKAENILADLKNALAKYRPNKIFVSHPQDVNSDHKAFYLFLEVALGDLKRILRRPKIYTYLIHSVGWPLPRHYHPELSLEPPAKFNDSLVQWSKYDLASEQLGKKHKAILCYNSQTRSSAFYLLSFARKNELFSNFADINLIKPYNVTLKQQAGSSWQAKVTSALDELSWRANNLGYFNTYKPSVFVDSKNKVSYGLDNDSFVMRIRKPPGYKDRFILVAYLFGYSYRMSFAKMPKFSIIIKGEKFKLFDAGRLSAAQGIVLEPQNDDLILKVPLKILKDPDFILVSLRAYGDKLPPEVSAFRKVNIRR